MADHHTAGLSAPFQLQGTTLATLYTPSCSASLTTWILRPFRVVLASWRPPRLMVMDILALWNLFATQYHNDCSLFFFLTAWRPPGLLAPLSPFGALLFGLHFPGRSAPRWLSWVPRLTTYCGDRDP